MTSRCSDLLFSILFADDTSVFIEGTNYDNIIYILNIELKHMAKSKQPDNSYLKNPILYDVSPYTH